MALIKCPECGKEISSAATHCIHCGCRFSACPECGSVTVGEVAVCPSCGYALKQSAQPEASAIPEEKGDSRGLLERWRSENPVRRIYSSNLLQYAVWLVGALFFVIAFFKMLSWAKSDDFILSYKSTLSAVKTLAVIGTVICSIKAILGGIGPHVGTCDYAAWLGRRKVDVKEAFALTYGNDFSAISADEVGAYSFSLTHLTRAALYMKNAALRASLQMMELVAAGLAILGKIFLCVFAIQNAEIYMKTVFVLGRKHYELSMLEGWWALILWGACLAGALLLSQYNEKKMQSAMQEWVKAEMPEHYEAYDRYVLHWVDYVVEQSEKNQNR